MPRYMVERTFLDGLQSELCGTVIERNADEGVTWISSFVSADKSRTFCIYDAPSPEAVRESAARNGLPVDEITQVQVLDPYSFSQAYPGHPSAQANRSHEVANTSTTQL